MKLYMLPSTPMSCQTYAQDYFDMSNACDKKVGQEILIFNLRKNWIVVNYKIFFEHIRVAENKEELSIGVWWNLVGCSTERINFAAWSLLHRIQTNNMFSVLCVASDIFSTKQRNNNFTRSLFTFPFVHVVVVFHNISRMSS